MSRNMWIRRWAGVVAVTVLVAAPARMLSAAPAHTIGVVDFTARASVQSMFGTMPSTSTANQATMQLPGVASTSLEVIPRSAMTRAQSDLKWRGSDITVYARLTALAAAVHATYLVVGTIDRVSVDRLTNTANRANATVYIQVFTVAPPQLTQAVTGMGASSATVVDRAAEAALREAVKQALPAALAKASLGR